MKRKWTFVDTLIVILVIVAGVALFKVFGTSTATGDTKTIEAVVLLAKEDKEVADAISEGDQITISLTEKDSGTLKSVKVEDAETMVYNSIDGKYVIEPVEGKVDIYATIELSVTENDYAFTSGSTVLKVGEKLPFRGKGYALEGYIIQITE
ncbi:MAG: DUF4330 domain-containing protein [Clostridia bacterium]|nr:DUF4330 domain-containing protein [Clostridia bacterium]